MRCYLKGYKNDRTCDICAMLDKDKHDKCKLDYELYKNKNLLSKMCKHCNIKEVWKRGTNEYGYDEDYTDLECICDKTDSGCEVTEECLNTLIKEK